MVHTKNLKSGGSGLASNAELLNKTKSKVVTFLGHVTFVRDIRDTSSHITSVEYTGMVETTW
jgi:hypothetical protein